jgi:triacylglycerol lipase
MLGDANPDFYTASRQFGTGFMQAFNERNKDAANVYYQSYAAVMKDPLSDIFLWLPCLLVWLVEGENDGLVTPASATWTNFKGILRGTTRRGISHADQVDARRMNLTRKKCEGKISDIRDFYIEVIVGLKEMGL